MQNIHKKIQKPTFTLLKKNPPGPMGAREKNPHLVLNVGELAKGVSRSVAVVQPYLA